MGRVSRLVDRFDFGLYSPAASEVNLLLFTAPDSKSPSHLIPMQRKGDDWRIKIRGPEAKPGLFYMYQAKGIRELSLARQYGTMFNEQYPLSDPYAFQTQGVSYSRVFAATPFADNSTSVYAGGGKSIIYDHSRDPFPGHVNQSRGPDHLRNSYTRLYGPARRSSEGAAWHLYRPRTRRSQDAGRLSRGSRSFE